MQNAKLSLIIYRLSLITNNSGFTLIVAIYTFAFASILVLGVLLLLYSDVIGVAQNVNEKKATYIADGGIEEGIYTLKTNGGFLWELGSVSYGPTNCDGSATCWGTRLAGDYYSDSDQSIVTPVITISSVSNQLFLHFRNWFKTETNVDGGFIEVSTNYGATWADISCVATTGWYGGILSAASPYGAHSAFSGNQATANNAIAWSNAGCQMTTANYVGKDIMIRFLFWANDNTNFPGWYIDTVKVCDGTFGTLTCTTPLLNDNLESGIGGWTNFIADFPYNFGTALVSIIAEESTPEYDTYVMTSTGRLTLPTFVKKVKARVTVHGNVSPYTVKIHSWKRYL